MAIDNTTGDHGLAMVRRPRLRALSVQPSATQVERIARLGSSFKSLRPYATAVEDGAKPSDTILDVRPATPRLIIPHEGDY